MKTSHCIWDITEDREALVPYQVDGKPGILVDMLEDTDDGIFSRVSDWTRFANSVDKSGCSAWLNRFGSKNKLNINFGYCNIIRESKLDTEVILEFTEGVDVVFGKIGDNPIIKSVSKIRGEFKHDWYFKKSGRQDKIANGLEVYFIIHEYLE